MGKQAGNTVFQKGVLTNRQILFRADCLHAAADTGSGHNGNHIRRVGPIVHVLSLLVLRGLLRVAFVLVRDQTIEGFTRLNHA